MVLNRIDQADIFMPGRVMILRSGIFTLLFTFFLLGCSSTTKPLVWKAEDVALSDFTVFEIQPVLNATDKYIDQGILSILTVYLKEQFEVKNLHLIDPTLTKSKVLGVQSEILVYEVKLFMSPAPPAKNMTALCVLRTRLFQQSSGNVVAEIITVNKSNVGQGLFEPKSPEYVLKKSAAAVAKEVAKMM